MAASYLQQGKWLWSQSSALERALEDAFARRLYQAEKPLSAGEDLDAATIDAEEANSYEQRRALSEAFLGAFKSWAAAAGFMVDKWTISDQGVLLNPLGDGMSTYDAACSLQRIAEMKTIDGEAAVYCFRTKHGRLAKDHETPELPIELRKSGQATVVIWALWDGRQCVGEARADMPATPSVLIGLEGYGPEEAEWKEPHKVYALMEYGFKLCSYSPSTDARSDEREADGYVPF